MCCNLYIILTMEPRNESEFVMDNFSLLDISQPGDGLVSRHPSSSAMAGSQSAVSRHQPRYSARNPNNHQAGIFELEALDHAVMAGYTSSPRLEA